MSHTLNAVTLLPLSKTFLFPLNLEILLFSCFLDLSAAFDSIDHAILLSRLKTSFGFDVLVCNWIESYHTGCSQTVAIGINSSASTHVASGVPQGSVLSLLLSAPIPPLLLLLLPLSLSLSSNLPMTHNFIFLFLHLTSIVESIAFKNVSPPCTPGAAITHYPLILTSLTLFSSELGNALTLSKFLGCHHGQRCGLGCSNGGSCQVTRRHTRQPPVDGQARE
jgi:Reverse transcriptase (RNA-dependent DNA polymerase)